MAELPPLRTQVGADVAGFTGGMNKAVAALGGFQGALGATGAAVAAFAGAKGLGAAVRAFADFDEKMTESQAIMGDLSGQTMAEMEEAALDVSTTTVKSAGEAAESYFFLASAGLDAEQSIAALPEVAEFAQAGMFDMATATDLATDAQSALGLTVEDTEQNLKNLSRVTDVFTRANQLANATVEQFSESITNKLGARLRILNKDIEEGVAGLAALADQGIKGRKAGRGLNIVLRDLSARAVKNAQAFRDLGIRVFDADGNMRNLADIVADFEGVLEGASTQEQVMAFEMLGLTRRAQDFLAPLIGLSDELREFEDELRNSQDAAGEVADKQLQTLNRQVGLLADEAERAKIQIGGMIGPGLTKDVRALRIVIRRARQEISQAGDAAGEAKGPLSSLDPTIIFSSTALGQLASGRKQWEMIRDAILASAEEAREYKGVVEELPTQPTVQGPGGRLEGFTTEGRRERIESAPEEEPTAREREIQRQREQAARKQKGLADARRKVIAEELDLTTVLLDRERRRLDQMIQQGKEAKDIRAQFERVAQLQLELERKAARGKGIAQIDVEAPDVEPTIEEGIRPPEFEEGEGPGAPKPPEVEGQDMVDPELLRKGGEMDEFATILESAAIPALDQFAGELGLGTSALANFLDSVLTSVGSALSGKEGGLGFLGTAISSFAGGFQHGGRIPAGKVGLVGEAGPELVRGPASVEPGGAMTINVNTRIEAVDSRGVERVVRSGQFKEAAVEAVMEATRHSRGVSRAIVSGGS